jgi:phospholipase C
MRDNFAFFDSRKISFLTKAAEAGVVRGNSFLDDAADGKLPQVSWIDPNFIDVSVLETQSNDDHPPSDIRAGQSFVFEVYNALMHSKDWKDTLLIVTYDEHGGFYDHVTPPPLPADDPARPEFTTYGLRVPALFAGPRVRRQVLHAAGDPGQPQYDHATLIKTILLAFAADPAKALAAMPARVRTAPHLGAILLDEARTDIDDPRNARDLMDAWRQEARRRRAALPPAATPGPDTRSAAPDGAGHPTILTDFQADWQKFAQVMRGAGLQP